MNENWIYFERHMYAWISNNQDESRKNFKAKVLASTLATAF